MSCSDHGLASSSCEVCKRIGVERRIVRKTVLALLAAGYLLSVDDGGDGLACEPTTRLADILAALGNTDVDTLMAENEVHRAGVQFVYGNDGGENVICDYSMRLEDVLGPVMAYAETLA
jgi:hypothetical protein